MEFEYRKLSNVRVVLRGKENFIACASLYLFEIKYWISFRCVSDGSDYIHNHFF